MSFGAVGVALLIVWTLFALYLVYSLFINYYVFPDRAKMVYCKDCTPSKPVTIRYKYIISFFLDNWANDMDRKNTNIYIELITKTNKKMIALTIKPDDLINKRARLLLHRKKVLRPLTAVRAIHDCTRPNTRIHLTGIKVQDMKYGAIIYYTIDRNIYYQSMSSAVVHKVNKPELKFLSEQMLSPNFIQIRTDNYSSKVIAKYSNY